MSAEAMTKKLVLGEDSPDADVLELKLSHLAKAKKKKAPTALPANIEEFDDMWDNVPV